ncbi:MAG: phage portal protein [Clostridia bacterium]|nr:phage portal protein [Clostridia bacterium]
MKFPFLKPAAKRYASVFDLPQTPDIAAYYRDCIDLFSRVYAGHLRDWHDLSVVTPDGVKNRVCATLRAAKAVCAELAQLICSEGVSLNVASNYRSAAGDDFVADRILSVFRNAGFDSFFPAFVERVLAEGGGAAALFADVENHALSLRFYAARDFIPLRWEGAAVVDARLIDRICVDGSNYVLITRHRHENGVTRIERELYRDAAAEALGEQVALGDVLPSLQTQQVFEGVSGPLFVYFAPAGCNNLAPSLPLGCSVYANALDTLRSLDIAFDSLRNEFLMGKKRIIVPAAALRRVVDPDTGNAVRYFDNSNGVYEALNIDEEESLKIVDQTSVLRIDEHITAINALLDILCMQTGLSYGSLSFSGGVPKTATEVVSINSKSFRTKQLHQNAFSDALRLLVEAVFEALRCMKLLPDDVCYELSVSYADSIITDDAANEKRILSRVDAGLQSRADAIADLFGVTKVEARERLAEIDSETEPAPLL